MRRVVGLLGGDMEPLPQGGHCPILRSLLGAWKDHPPGSPPSASWETPPPFSYSRPERAVDIQSLSPHCPFILLVPRGGFCSKDESRDSSGALRVETLASSFLGIASV